MGKSEFTDKAQQSHRIKQQRQEAHDSPTFQTPQPQRSNSADPISIQHFCDTGDSNHCRAEKQYFLEHQDFPSDSTQCYCSLTNTGTAITLSIQLNISQTALRTQRSSLHCFTQQILAENLPHARDYSRRCQCIRGETTGFLVPKKLRC